MQFGMQLTFKLGSGGEYQIYEIREDAMHGMDADGNEVGVVWRRAYDDDEDLGEYFWPADMRAEYERLNDVPEFSPNWSPEAFIAGTVSIQPNVVEFMDDEQAWDQPCVYGNRCSSHAVYCHNDGWLYSPRKCQRTWYTSGVVRDEDCPGFTPNPQFASKTQASN